MNIIAIKLPCTLLITSTDNYSSSYYEIVLLSIEPLKKTEAKAQGN